MDWKIVLFLRWFSVQVNRKTVAWNVNPEVTDEAARLALRLGRSLEPQGRPARSFFGSLDKSQ